MIMIIIFTVIIMMMMEEHFYSLDNSKLLLASLLSPHNRNLQLKCHFIPTNTTTNYCHLNYNNNRRGWEGSLSLRTSINRTKWQSASEELKGGDGEWHASLGRLCAANKKCVSVCQSARASGPICTPLSPPLSLCLLLSAQLSLPAPLLHCQCRRQQQHCHFQHTGEEMYWYYGAARERITISIITSITVTASPLSSFRGFFPPHWFAASLSNRLWIIVPSSSTER